MGCGHQLRCSKCGEKYIVYTGVGMNFPSVYQKVLDDVKAGKYGQEWKNIAEKEPDIAVDAELYLYKCKKCNHWDIDYGLSLYASNDTKDDEEKNEIAEPDHKTETKATNRYTLSPKTVLEIWKSRPRNTSYVTSLDLELYYHIIKRRIHKCEKCGSVMHKVRKEEESNLPCPDCGGAPDKDYFAIINWD